ncbi:MAG TPA: GatB/YqeY domain-containing protein [Cyanothece sp. UBA12306]|nr:GatB/YqeY domain-containing protein [Cyanothece sp. UBA12306]
MAQTVLTGNKLVKFLKKTIKITIATQGIDRGTRSGDKELDLLARKLAKRPFISLEQTQTVAEKVAQSIIELSQEKGKKNLDQGIIKQVALKTKFEVLVPSPQTTSDLPSASPTETVSQAEVQTTSPQNPEIISDTDQQSPITVIQEESPSSETKEEEEKKQANSDLKGLKERITEDIKAAMKAKDKIRLETVRSIKKALLEKEVSLRPSGQETLTPEQELELLSQEAKQRRDSIEQYRQGGRDDLADKEAAELAIIETYLPPQLSEEELGKIIEEIIASVGATSSQDMGRVMGTAMQQLKGKADGKKVQQLVKDKLA